MKDGLGSALLAGLLVMVAPVASSTPEEPRLALVLHGGAGTMRPSDLTDELERPYRSKLQEALETGFGILAGGGSSLDAVEATIRVLEDSELFNAGKGAVFTSEGKNELDASIMDGSTLRAAPASSIPRLAAAAVARSSGG